MGEWGRSLPPEDAEGLLDPSRGRGLRWTEGKGWKARYPLVGVVPLTGTEGRGALYPRIPAGTGGLRKDSWALTDKVRSTDKRRVRVAYGPVEAGALESIDEGMRLSLGLIPEE